MKRKNDNTEGGRKRKRSPIAVFLCLVLIGIAVAAVFWIWRTGRLPASANGRNIYRGEEVQDKIISSGDGDYLLRPGTNALKYDKTAGAFYFEGLLMVFLASEPSDDQAWELAEAVDGQIAGMVKGDANLLQIRTEEKDFAGLQELAERLMQEEEVLYARYDYPVFPEENLTGQDTNPWISDDKKDEGYNSFDESNPSGYNWWAEAIGAYTAWQYTDQCSDYKIGIVDNGYKFDHEELQGKMFMLEGTASRISDHGTHVAGIIGAENNYAGIRGIADTADLLVVDWTQEDERKESYIGSGEVLALIGNMTEQGVQVVNNSWNFGNLPSYWNGYVFGSDNQGFFKMSRGDYNEYIESKKNYATQTGMDALITINQLLMAGNERFLIVQSAGNGYNGSGKDGGYDSKWNGHFCSMVNARERYESTVQKFYEKTNRKCASYTEIRDHALIVSGVKNERNNSGQYQIESNFNYGDDVDIYAPGKDIYSTLAEENYGKSDGTSMAAPMVTASAAMLWALEPELSVSEVRHYLLDYAGEAYNENGAVFPMLNVGASVEALAAGGSQGSGPDEEGMEKADDTVTPNGMSGGELSEGDCSKGVYRMGGIAERDGKLYYIKDEILSGSGDSEDEIIYHLDPLTGKQEVFITGDENRHLRGLLATEQFLYVAVQHPAQQNVEIYDYSGKLIGNINDVESYYIYFDGGYLYYGDKEICRVPVKEGAVSLADPDGGTSEEDRRITAGEERLENGFVLIEDSIYYWTEYEQELVRLSKDGQKRETLSTGLNEYADLDTDDERLIYGGSMLGKTINENPAIVYAMDFSGASRIRDREIFRDDGSGKGPVSSLLEGGSGYIGEGAVIGNVYVYVYHYTNEEGKINDRIHGYNLDTGEHFIITEEDRWINLYYVSGQSRVYYSADNVSALTQTGETDYYCIEVYGGASYKLPDAMNGPFEQQYYQYDY